MKFEEYRNTQLVERVKWHLNFLNRVPSIDLIRNSSNISIMDTTIQFIFLLILCTQLCYTSGQPPRTGFRLRLSEFDDTLEKATHDQKVKILERLLKNIHEKSKNANPRNSNESPENLDAMKETSTYVDSGEPQLSNIREGKNSVKIFLVTYFWGTKILYLTFFISHQCLNRFCSNFQAAFLRLCM